VNIRDLVPEGRIAHIVYEDTVDDVTYCIWKEKIERPSVWEVGGPITTPDTHAVHVYNANGLLRSGEYRLTQIEALQLVVDLMGGVTV